jgi:hypothetical protein
MEKSLKLEEVKLEKKEIYKEIAIAELLINYIC